MAMTAELPMLRGDYGRAAPDFTIAQDMAAYGAADHAIWRFLHDRQRRLLANHAAPDVVAALDGLDVGQGVPDLEQVSGRLAAATGWRLVCVPGLIPDAAFFDHLAHRRFPVTSWLRRGHELDYLVEPDIFHDFFGHVPMLFDPDFADFLAAYGRAADTAMAVGALAPLARLYWYTVEFGLVRTPGGVRAFGAGILSSAQETIYAVTSDRPRRLVFDRHRVMRTGYRIDALQSLYFVLDDIAQLRRALDGDIVAAAVAAGRSSVWLP